MIVMSNNQWLCDRNCPWWQERGLDCSAEARAPGFVRAYKEIDADVVGLQEVSRKMEALIMDELRPLNYEIITGGDTPILFRRDRVKLLESGFFRYTEDIPGLVGSFNNVESKSYTWGMFETRDEAKKRFALLSTHLWWKSSAVQPGSNEARAYQIRQASAALTAVMERYNCFGIIMGDLNASMDSLCLKAAGEEGWTDVHYLAAESDDTRGHHPCGPNGYSRQETFPPFSEAIDHILIKNGAGVKISYFRRLTDAWFDPISDHYPLYCDLEW